MAKKSLGYVELEWICPNCSTRNPGGQKTCASCGMPQPEDVQFQQQAQGKLITDEAKLEKAEAGPDIHCHYCGSRNSGDAKNCSQCGADLTEGSQRTSGKVLGAHRDKPAKPLTCPSCGTENSPTAPKCKQCGASLAKPSPPPSPSQAKPAVKPSPSAKSGVFGGVGLLAVLAMLCIGCAVAYFMLAGQTEDVTGTVSGVRWTRTIQLEGLAPVTYQDWYDEIPRDGEVGSCTRKVQRVQDNPAANAREVCGTPYTVDSGSGFGEVVQDCKYEIYEDYCEYTVVQWREIEPVTLSGSGYQPRWPVLDLRKDQRESGREERYLCVFSTPNGEFVYGSSNPDFLNRCMVGSRWLLQVNAFNAVTQIEPAP